MATLLACALTVSVPAGDASADDASADDPVDIVAIRSAKRVNALRITETISIDGALDEAAWQRAEVTADFYQQQPAEFSLATRRTEVRFLYDNDTLYMGAILYDPEPSQLITNELKRDFSGSSGDGFGLILDPFQDRRNAYGFVTNPGGAQREALGYENGRRNDGNWHGVWSVKTRIREDGWSIEYAIPFKTLRFPDREVQEWGLNMIRWARRANETSTWAPVPRQFTHYNVAYAGTLSGITDVVRGNQLQVKPFLTGDVSSGLNGGSDAWVGSADGGIDAKWGVTSSLLLDATWRTDFSQVEADEQQINLTRFGLFQAEKREFFLESPSAFQIGLLEAESEDPRRDLVPFFSRRIGLSADGRPIPVIGGVRLTGRAGRQGIGFLSMQTEDFEGRPGDNFTAARVSRDITDTLSAAGFYFGREAYGTPGFNRVAGFDIRARPARTVEVEAFAMGSDASERGSDWAGRAGFRIDTRKHRARAGFLYVGDNFQDDLGYVRRRGVATLFGRYVRAFRPANTDSVVREYTFGVQGESTQDEQFAMSLTRVGTAEYTMSFANSGQFRASVTTTDEHIDSSFTVGSGDNRVVVPAGDYAFDEAAIEYSSNKSAALSGSIELGAGEYWDGDQRRIAGSARWRFNAHLATSVTVSRNDVHLPTGAFDATLLGMRMDWSLTPRMFLNAYVQRNTETDAWVTNIRFNLIHRPLSDIYVVWNDTRIAGIPRRALLLKYTHLLAF